MDFYGSVRLSTLPKIKKVILQVPIEKYFSLARIYNAEAHHLRVDPSLALLNPAKVYRVEHLMLITDKSSCLLYIAVQQE